MLKIMYLPGLLLLTTLIPITALATEQHKSTSPNAIQIYARKQTNITIRGKIYLDAKPLPEAQCNKKLITVTLRRIKRNPNYNASRVNEPYTYKTIANSDSQNHRISGDIKRGYCEYVLREIPQIKGNYELKADIKSDEQFPTDAPSYCTVSPVFSEPIGWENPMSISSDFDINKDMKLTRVVAKCQP
jgi:hypothetical protein